jgi:hypothetical protein
MKTSVTMLLAMVLTIFIADSFCAQSSKVKAARDPVTNLTNPEEKLYQDEIFQKTPLYYYHLFVKGQGKVTTHKMPSTAHYEAERQSRIQHFVYKNEIFKLREQKTFASNDIKHEILKLQNHKISLQEKLKFFEKRVAQRETAIKFQIDHDFAWRTFYKKRFSANERNVSKALPDEVDSLEKMITFDKERATYWYDSATQQYMLLGKRSKEDRLKHEGFSTAADEIDDKILSLKLEHSQVVKKADIKIQDIAVKDELLMKILAGDGLKDTQKMENDKLEEQKFESDKLFEVNGVAKKAKKAKKPLKKRGGQVVSRHVGMHVGPVRAEMHKAPVKVGPKAERPKVVAKGNGYKMAAKGNGHKAKARKRNKQVEALTKMAKGLGIKSVKITANGKIGAKLKTIAQRKKAEALAEKRSA